MEPLNCLLRKKYCHNLPCFFANFAFLLPPANEVWGKVIFSEACVKNSVHRGGSTWAGTPPTRYTLLGPGTHPGLGTLPPQGPGTLPGTRYTPPDQVHPPGPGTRSPPPREQCMLQDTGNKRAVRILLECILVFEGYYLGFGFFSRDAPVLKPWLLPLKWQMYLVICIVTPVCATIIASYWSRNKWGNHHLAKTLQVRFVLRQAIF